MSVQSNSHASSKNTAVLFLSHIPQRTVMQNFDDIKNAGSNRYETFFLCDNSKDLFSKYLDNSGFVPFTVEKLMELAYPQKSNIEYKENVRNRNPFHKYFNFHPGNCELPLLWFYLNNPHFEYYWLIEYDVHFSGSWDHLFSHFETSKSDLLGTTFASYEESTDWPHWPGLDFADHGIGQDEYLRGFFPIYRISNRALRQIHDDYMTGVNGHMEGLVPTLLRRAGQKLEDIGGDSDFVKSENRNRFYRNTPSSDRLTPGTLIFRPAMDRPGNEKNTLWHPVKYRPAWKRAVSFCHQSARQQARSLFYK